MNKLLLLFLFSGILLVVGLNANFNEFRLSRSFQIAVVPDDAALIKLIPVKPYADLVDGKLIVKFGNSNLGSGVSPDSKYIFDKVFCIESSLGKEDTIVIISISVELREFVKVYSPESVSSKSPEDSSDKIVIPSGENKACVGFVIDTKSVSMGEYSGKVEISVLKGGDSE